MITNGCCVQLGVTDSSITGCRDTVRERPFMKIITVPSRKENEAQLANMVAAAMRAKVWESTRAGKQVWLADKRKSPLPIRNISDLALRVSPIEELCRLSCFYSVPESN